MSPDLVLVTLDSDHIVEITQQTSWLDNTLKEYEDSRWKIVQYHVAAWPGVRDFSGSRPLKIRNNWIPVFEKHNVNFVIEAHDHAYKKYSQLLPGWPKSPITSMVLLRPPAPGQERSILLNMASMPQPLLNSTRC